MASPGTSRTSDVRERKCTGGEWARFVLPVPVHPQADDRPFQPLLDLRLQAGSTTSGVSTLEQSTADRPDLLLAVLAPKKPPVMTGAWGGLTFLYTPGPPVLARTGRFRFLFDASGNLNSTSWT